MRSNSRFPRLSAIAITIVILTSVWIVAKSAKPRPSAATEHRIDQRVVEEVETVPPPKFSIVFVIDNSPNMFPRFGPNYFDLAKEAILDFVTLPGFTNRPNGLVGSSTVGTYEVSVIQFTERTAIGYTLGDAMHTGPSQWFKPIHVTDSDKWDSVMSLVENLERSDHYSGSLMELGIREATWLLKTSSAADTNTKKHIVLLTTGEYRLPEPCPPGCFVMDNPLHLDIPQDAQNGAICPNDSWSGGAGSACEDMDCDADCSTALHPLGGGGGVAGTSHGGTPLGSSGSSSCSACNRACRIRYFANVARQNNITLSAVHLGPDWHNYQSYDCPEDLNPYDNYSCPDLPLQPDRAGFLNELTQAMCHESDVPPQPHGHYWRANPYFCLGCDPTSYLPSTSRGTASTIASWFCDWSIDPANQWKEDFDHDLVKNLCDNCPSTSNGNQRDCNRNGIGDACECAFRSACPANQSDNADHDGVFDVEDMCLGGDDCYVANWTSDFEHYAATCNANYSSTQCGCDCDHDGQADICQKAKEISTMGAPPSCQGDPLHCRPIPKTCDLENMPNQTYNQDFESFTTGQLADGWYDSSLGSGGHVSIKIDPPLLGGENKVLQLTGGAGATPWYVESPGLQPPSGTCAWAGQNDCPLVDPWGVTFVDVTMKIMNQESLNTSYDLYLLDACEQDVAKATRAHLRFLANPATTQGDGAKNGTIQYEVAPFGSWYSAMDNAVFAGSKRCTINITEANDHCPSTDNPYDCSHGWFTVRIAINVAAHFDITQQQTCEWSGGRRAIRLHYSDPSPWYDENQNNPAQAWDSFGTDESNYCYELGDLRPDKIRGFRLRFVDNNESTSSNSYLRIGRVHISSGYDACQWANLICGTGTECTCRPGAYWDCY